MAKKIITDDSSFTDLIESGAIYVDKTAHIARFVDLGKYIFLSRPRRFGKSLLISTLEALFLGKRALFTGLAIEEGWNWQEYPVLRFDFTRISADNALELKQSLQIKLDDFADEYGIELAPSGLALRFGRLLEKIFHKTGKKVVILVDEYDKPITEHLHNIEIAEANRDVLGDFYGALKGSGDHLKLLFITGVSKFAKVSIFSKLNNVKDLTLNPDFNDICGFTQAELEGNFIENIEAAAQKLGMTYESLLRELKERYDGYAWTGAEKVYNPFSILNTLAEAKLKNFWSMSGAPTFLIKRLQQEPIQLFDWINVRMNEGELEPSDLRNMPLPAILFQTGYLTVSAEALGIGGIIYTLNFPNKEVRETFLAKLLPAYAATDSAKTLPDIIDLRDHLLRGDADAATNILKRYVHNIPSGVHIPEEHYYQTIAYIALSLAGLDISLEAWKNTGILDGVLELPDAVYLMEFKFAKTGKPETQAKRALKNILEKNYPSAWQDQGKKLRLWGLGVANRQLAGVCYEWKSGDDAAALLKKMGE